jgi:hypothetical protein
MDRKQSKNNPKVEEDCDEALKLFECSLFQMARLRN